MQPFSSSNAAFRRFSIIFEQASFHSVAVGISAATVRASYSPFMMVFTEKKVSGTFYGSVRPDLDFPVLVDHYMNRKLNLDGLISRTYRLEEINEGFKRMMAGEVARVGVFGHGADDGPILTEHHQGAWDLARRVSARLGHVPRAFEPASWPAPVTAAVAPVVRSTVPVALTPDP